MKFAPGTPQSVIKAAEQAQKNKPKVDKTKPLPPKSTTRAPRPTTPMPFKPDLTDPVRPRSPIIAQPRTGVLPSKPANAPMEQVEIDKAKKMAATPQTYMPQANTVPNAGMAAMQKMPQPNTVPPANARPMGPPSMAMKKGGSTSKASGRADGIAKKGKTKGRYI